MPTPTTKQLDALRLFEKAQDQIMWPGNPWTAWDVEMIPNDVYVEDWPNGHNPGELLTPAEGLKTDTVLDLYDRGWVQPIHPLELPQQARSTAMRLSKEGKMQLALWK